jgi:Domain of unknown function (DUF4760)
LDITVNETMNNLKNPDEVRKINLSFPIGIASIATGIAVGLIGTYAYFAKHEGKPITELLNFSNQVIGAAAASVGAAYALQSIRYSSKQQNQNQKENFTSNLIQQWDSSAIVKARETINIEIHGRTNPPALPLDAKSEAELIQSKTLLLNFLEKVAIYWKKDMLDETLLNEFFNSIIIQSWKELNVYVVERRRDKGDDTIYRNLESLYENMINLK